MKFSKLLLGKKKLNNLSSSGFSLVEIMVVITIFAVIGVLTTRSIFLTLRGARKSDSLVRVRENINYTTSTIERLIRNADYINCTTSTSTELVYQDQMGEETNFSCISDYIASGSANVRLTSTDVKVTGCSFTCSQLNPDTPPTVKLSITAEDALSTSEEKGVVTSDIEITARNY